MSDCGIGYAVNKGEGPLKWFGTYLIYESNPMFSITVFPIFHEQLDRPSHCPIGLSLPRQDIHKC